jgi:hypothetical protein
LGGGKQHIAHARSDDYTENYIHNVIVFLPPARYVYPIRQAEQNSAYNIKISVILRRQIKMHIRSLENKRGLRYNTKYENDIQMVRR